MITDIVVEINDFLIIPNTVVGFLYLSKNGGINLMAKSVVNQEKYLIQKFFESIKDITPVVPHDPIFYCDVEVPPILLDYLLDNDTDENILVKINQHLEQNASWLERKGLMAIAEMTFNNSMCNTYKMYNMENLRLIEQLSKHFRVHLLGNCSRKSFDNMDPTLLSFVSSITTSADIKDVKCSSTDRLSIYHKFLTYHINAVPEGLLFIETNIGYINTLNNYDPNIKTILYRGGTEKEKFVNDLSLLLGVPINFNYIKKGNK